MAKVETYRGNCHCQTFKFTVKTLPLTKVFDCNCSICRRNGALWLLGVDVGDVTVERGFGTLSEYLLNPINNNVTVLFCPKCGTTVMERKRDGTLILNVRTFADVDLDALETISYDGSKTLPLYIPPPFPDHYEDNKPDDGLKLYGGNCNCGAVQYIVKFKPLEDVDVICCNCSSCSRNGDLWIYPSRSAVKVHGKDALFGYTFLHEDSLHSFCRTCGVSVLVDVTKPGSDVVPINVRTMNDVDLDGLKLRKYDGRARDPQYVIA